jgi:predicted nucleic acid-binding protein
VIVVDSSVWIARLQNHQTPAVSKFNSIRDTDEVLVGDIVLMEVLQGARNDRDAARIEYHLRAYRITTIMSPAIAVRAAANFRELRSKGITIRKSIDLMIGTFCIEHGHALLHNDRDFEPMIAHLGLQAF